MIRMTIAAVVSVVCLVNIASATSFAILFDRKPDDDEPALVVSNPLFQNSGMSGENPMFEPKSLVFDPGQLWQGAPAEFRVTMDTDLPTLPPAPKGAFVFGLFLTDTNSGAEIHQLAQSVLITADAGSPTNREFTFGTFDQDAGAWSEIAKATKKGDGLYCGTTDHFSFFYFAPVPEPGTWALVVAAAVTAGVFRLRRRSVV